jgi:AAA family ATP:ADP antiporter
VGAHHHHVVLWDCPAGYSLLHEYRRGLAHRASLPLGGRIFRRDGRTVLEFYNDMFHTESAKKWYAFIGSGLIVGGLCGSAICTLLVKQVGTLNLIYVCEGILALLIVLSYVAQRVGYKEKADAPAVAAATGQASKKEKSSETPDIFQSFRLVANDSYLTLILILVVITQIINATVDYQFNHVVQTMKSSMDHRTALLANVDIWINIASLSTMFFLTQPVLRYFGVMVGLLVLPVANLLGFGSLLSFPLPMLVIGIKVYNKFLGYSINRVSKELLYVPTPTEWKYKAKAVIDMFGYRFSKLLGSALIIPIVAYAGNRGLSVVNLMLTILQIGVVVLVCREYTAFREGEAAPVASEPEFAPA